MNKNLKRLFAISLLIGVVLAVGNGRGYQPRSMSGIDPGPANGAI